MILSTTRPRHRPRVRQPLPAGDPRRQSNADSLAAFVTGHTNVMATWAQGTASPAQADVMASFSSRGPLGDWIKPDVTAPGVQVLAGTTPQPDQTTADNGPPGNLYHGDRRHVDVEPALRGCLGARQGGAPDVDAGGDQVGADDLVACRRSSRKTASRRPTPFDMGAGSIRADRAVNPTLVFNETYADFVAAGTRSAPPDRPQHRERRRNDDVRRDHDDADGAQRLRPEARRSDVASDHAAGRRDDHGVNNDDRCTSPRRVAHLPDHDQRSGRRERPVHRPDQPDPRNGGNTVTIPVAFVKKQGIVTLTNTCSSAELPDHEATRLSHCTVDGGELRQHGGEREPRRRAAASGQAPDYKNIGAPGSVIGTGDGVHWSGTLSPAVAAAGNAITDITRHRPDGGYLAAVAARRRAGRGRR